MAKLQLIFWLPEKGVDGPVKWFSGVSWSHVTPVYSDGRTMLGVEKRWPMQRPWNIPRLISDCGKRKRMVLSYDAHDVPARAVDAVLDLLIRTTVSSARAIFALAGHQMPIAPVDAALWAIGHDWRLVHTDTLPPVIAGLF